MAYTVGVNVDIERQLKDAARQSGLSMYALSKRSGVNYSGLHGFLTGDRRLSLRVAARLAVVLGLELHPVRRGKQKG